jgi:hypothetical protein
VTACRDELRHCDTLRSECHTIMHLQYQGRASA